MNSSAALTGHIRHGGQLLCPEFRHLDGLLLHGLAGGGVALFVGVRHDLAEVVRVHGVEDVEEVLARRSLVLGVLVGEVAVHGVVLLELRPQRLRGQLLVVRHFDGVDLVILEQLLPAGQHLLEEVLVDERLGRQVELEAVHRMESMGEFNKILRK